MYGTLNGPQTATPSMTVYNSKNVITKRVVTGATYIEKHFTIDKNMEGPDHKASLNPNELNEFVSLIRECETIMGDGIKICKDSELNTKSVNSGTKSQVQ